MPTIAELEPTYTHLDFGANSWSPVEIDGLTGKLGQHYYFNTLSGAAPDTNWSLSVDTFTGGTLLTWGLRAVIWDGSAGYGLQVCTEAGTSLFEVQGIDGTGYFKGNLGLGRVPAYKLDVDAPSTRRPSSATAPG